MPKLIMIALIFILSISATAPAYAYVDPGSGSLLIQLIIAMSVGVMFYFRTIREKIKKLLRIEKGSRSEPDKSDDRN